MASKIEDTASKHNDNGSKQQGGGRRRGHDKNQNSSKHHEEGAPKKKNAGQSSTRHGNRGRAYSGGKDAPQHRSELQQQSGGSGASTKSSWSRENSAGHAKQQNRSLHHRNNASNSTSGRSAEQGRRGQQSRSQQDRSRAHRQQQLAASRNSEPSAENTNATAPLDSGIGMDGGSSPEAAPENGHIATGSVSSTDGEQEMLAEQNSDPTLMNSCEHVSLAMVAKATSGDKENEAPPQHDDADDDSSEKNMAHVSYSRKQLIEMKECVQSLLKPSGLDKIPAELLKTSNRHAGEAWESHHGDMELGEDGKAKHPTTLSLIREHDMKQMTRVSLSPQRRSFGSGCSWREQLSSLNRQSNAVSIDGTAPADQEDTPEQHGTPVTHPLGLHSYAHGATPSSPHGHTHHPPRVIAHVPYRSRHSHGELPHHWRESPPQQDDQEPEWMAFGPSDRTEFIELKGLDEHEARKEAERQAQGRDDGTGQEFEKETLDQPDPMPEEAVYANPTRDERRRSESPTAAENSTTPHHPPLKEDFVLDGFDFSTGLSICHTLEADSDEEEEERAKPTTTPTIVSSSEEISSALMKVLGIGADKTVTGQASTGKVKAVTLDEIEPPLTRPDDDGDVTAYHKLLEVLKVSGAMQDEVTTAETGTHHLGPFHGGARMAVPCSPMTILSPIAPPTKNGQLAGRPVYHGLERDDTAVLTAGSLHARIQSLDRQRILYPHTPPGLRSPHQTPLVQSSDLTGTKAARWSMGGQQWSALPSSSSASSSYPYYQQQQQHPSPVAASRLGLNHQQQQQHLGGNSTWVTEMERKRLAELRQMQHYQEYQQQQQSRHHPAYFNNRKAPGNPNNIHSPSTHGQVPNNLSLMPTAVIRQIHTSKANQAMSDMSQAQQQVPQSHMVAHSGRRLEHEATQRTNQNSTMMSGMHPQTEAQSSPVHPSPMMPSSRAVYHHNSAVYSGAAPHGLQPMQADPSMMAQTGYLNSQSFLPQQLRMGVATVKPSQY